MIGRVRDRGRTPVLVHDQSSLIPADLTSLSHFALSVRISRLERFALVMPSAFNLIDLLARTFSMGLPHHAMTGTGAVAIAAAAAIPGTVISRLVEANADGTVRFGHPSGTLSVGAETVEQDGDWTVTKVTMSRSARRLMEGWVRVPSRVV